MSGKERCKALKEIRKKIEEENDIENVVSECTFKGECKGTCPKCEAELRYLEEELEKRKKLGKAVVIVGVSAAVIAGMGVALEAADQAWNNIQEEQHSTTGGVVNEWS